MKSVVSASALALLSIATPALAQGFGGVPFGFGGGGLTGQFAPLLPQGGAAIVQGMVGATNRTALHQDMIARLRGDGGYLDGFAFGTPLAPSRQPVPPGFSDGQFGVNVINNFDGPVALATGNGNVVLQQNGASAGALGQQQVVTLSGGIPVGGGAANIVSGGGILQQAPSGIRPKGGGWTQR